MRMGVARNRSGIACEGGASDLIDFSVNVNPAGPSPRAVAAACKALSRIDAYPDRESLALVRALARAQGIPEDTIVCGAGASDIIWRLAAAVRPKRIVVCAPTFSEYAEAASYYGACVQEFPLSEADDFDVPASFARAIEGPGDVAYLCNPNNPTGRLVDPRVIDAAACRCEPGGRAARRGRVLPRICARRPRKERDRTRRVFAPCGRALRVHQALRNGGVAVGISDQRKYPTHRGDSPGGAGVARSPRSPRPRASPPWKTSNTSRARAMYWRASERGFPTSSPRSGFPSCRRMRTSF